MDISVIVCTFNRGAKLRNLLESLGSQSVPNELTWDVLVIDNNSTDSTARVAKDFCSAHHGHFHYEYEGRQGKSFALNTGISLAQGKIFAFTDDDAILPSDWLASIARAFAEDGQLAVIGGRVELLNSEDNAISTRRETRRQTVSRALFQANNIPIIGCNMAVRRHVFDVVGGFDTRFGPGSPGGVSEDLDFLYRACKAEFGLAFIPEVYVFHEHGRRTADEINRVRASYIVGRGAFYVKHIRKGDFYVAKLAAWEIHGILRRTLRAAISGSTVRKELSVLGHLLRGATKFALGKHGGALG